MSELDVWRSASGDDRVSLWTIGEVCAVTRLSRASIYRLMARGLFPKPVKIGMAKSVWPVTEVKAWVAARVAAR